MRRQEAQGLMLGTGGLAATMALSLMGAMRDAQQARADDRATDAAVRSWQDLVDDLSNENADLMQQNQALLADRARHLREIGMLRADVAMLQMRAADR